jgi:putative endonuclease
MDRQNYVYIMASKRNGTLYVGVTSNLVKRVWEHKHHLLEGFTSRYNVHELVYYEAYRDIRDAVMREKCIKKWNRRWKLKLIESLNPKWCDLYEELCSSTGFLPTQE